MPSSKLLEREAEITELTSVALPGEGIWQGTWQHNNQKERTMFNETPELIRQEYAERLQRAAQERFARQVTAGQSSSLRLLLAKVGDWLIAAGTRLQAKQRAAAAPTS